MFWVLFYFYLNLVRFKAFVDYDKNNLVYISFIMLKLFSFLSINIPKPSLNWKISSLHSLCNFSYYNNIVRVTCSTYSIWLYLIYLFFFHKNNYFVFTIALLIFLFIAIYLITCWNKTFSLKDYVALFMKLIVHYFELT